MLSHYPGTFVNAVVQNLQKMWKTGEHTKNITTNTVLQKQVFLGLRLLYAVVSATWRYEMASAILASHAPKSHRLLASGVVVLWGPRFCSVLGR